MQHDLVRFREFITLFRERRVLVVSVVNSLAVIVMACVLGIFLEVNEKRRAHAERVGRDGFGVEGVALSSPRSDEGRDDSSASPSPDHSTATTTVGAPTAAPTRALRTRQPPRPRSRSAPAASVGSRDYPVEVRQPAFPSSSPDPADLPALREDPLSSVEDSSGFDFERPPLEE